MFRAAAVESKLLPSMALVSHNNELDLAKLHRFNGLDFHNWNDGCLGDFSDIHQVVKGDGHINLGVEGMHFGNFSGQETMKPKE